MQISSLSSRQVHEIWHFVQTHGGVDQASSYGDVGVLYHLARRFGLIEILDEAAGKRSQGFSVGQLSIIMAINRCVDPTSKKGVVDTWYGKTALPQLDDTLPSTLSYGDVLSCLGYWTDAAIARAESALCRMLSTSLNADMSTLLWDATSLYLEGDACPIAHLGYSRDHRPDRPQVNYELIVTQEGQFPLYHRCYEGNINDVDRFSTTLTDFHQQYPDLHPTFIVDRGVVSLKNLETLFAFEDHVITALPLNRRWRPLLKKVACGWEYSGFRLNGTQYYFRTDRIKVGTTRCRILTYYSPKNAKQEASRREKKLRAGENALEALLPKLNQRQLKTREQIQAKVKRTLSETGTTRFLSVQVVRPRGSKGFTLRIKRRKRALARAAKRDGICMLLTDREELIPRDVLVQYRTKDGIESAFSLIKGTLSARPLFVRTPEHVKGHLFICTLAFLLHRLLTYFLEREECELSAHRALEALDTVRLTTIQLPESPPIPKLTYINETCQIIFNAVNFNPYQVLTKQTLALRYIDSG